MRRSLVITLSILLLLVAIVGVAWIHLRHNITPAAAEQIQAGMTQAEVESRLGGPPGKYYRWRDADARQRPRSRWLDLDRYVLSADADARIEEWVSDDFRVLVSFDTSGRVLKKTISPLDADAPPGFYLDGKNVMPVFLRDWIFGPPEEQEVATR